MDVINGCLFFHIFKIDKKNMTNTYDMCIVCIIMSCCQILSAGLPSDILTCELVIAIPGCLIALASICRIHFHVIHYSA